MKLVNRILVHVDSRRDNHQTVERAAELARANGAQLVLADIIPEPSWAARLFVANSDEIAARLTRDKYASLKALCEKLGDEGIQATSLLLEAPTSVALIREAIRGKYDLVIKEAKGASSRRPGFFGTTATRLIRKCPCPVLVLKPNDAKTWKHIVAAVDATSDDEAHAKLNQSIMEAAGRFCQNDDCRLDVIHAWSVYGEHLLRDHMTGSEYDAVLNKAQSHATEKLSEVVANSKLADAVDKVELLHGDAGVCVPKYVEDHDADLLVLGTIGRSGMAGLLMGNTAERTLDQVNCSVLTVKPEGFRTTIRMDQPVAETAGSN